MVRARIIAKDEYKIWVDRALDLARRDCETIADIGAGEG